MLKSFMRNLVILSALVVASGSSYEAVTIDNHSTVNNHMNTYLNSSKVDQFCNAWHGSSGMWTFTYSKSSGYGNLKAYDSSSPYFTGTSKNPQIWMSAYLPYPSNVQHFVNVYGVGQLGVNLRVGNVDSTESKKISYTLQNNGVLVEYKPFLWYHRDNFWSPYSIWNSMNRKYNTPFVWGGYGGNMLATNRYSNGNHGGYWLNESLGSAARKSGSRLTFNSSSMNVFSDDTLGDFMVPASDIYSGSAVFNGGSNGISFTYPVQATYYGLGMSASNFGISNYGHYSNGSYWVKSGSPFNMSLTGTTTSHDDVVRVTRNSLNINNSSNNSYVGSVHSMSRYYDAGISRTSNSVSNILTHNVSGYRSGNSLITNYQLSISGDNDFVFNSESAMVNYDANYSGHMYTNAGAGSIYVKSDSNGPSIYGIPSSSWSSGAVTLNLSSSDSRSGVNRIEILNSSNQVVSNGGSAVSYTVSTEGVNYLKVRAYDNVGNVTIQDIVIRVDYTNPTGVFNPNSQGWTNGSITTRFTPADYQSGVQRWRYSVSSNNGATWGGWSNYIGGSAAQNISFSSSGIHRVRAEVTDNVGRTYIVTSGEYRIDTVAPTVTLGGSSSEWFNSNRTFSVGGTDAHSGTNRYEYKLEGATSVGWTRYTSPVTVSNNGITRISVRSFDNSSPQNVSSVVTGEIRIDKVNPTTSISMPSVTTNRFIQVSFTGITELHSGGKEILVSNRADFGNSSKVTYSHNTPTAVTFELDKLATPDTNYSERTVYFKIIDKVGNYTVYEKKVTVNPIVPNKPVIKSPFENQLYVRGEMPELMWVYSDPNTDFKLPQQKAVVTLRHVQSGGVTTYPISGEVFNLHLNSLIEGDYDVSVTVYNWKNFSSTSDIRRFRYHKFKDAGNLRTIDIDPGAKFRYVKIMTNGTHSNELSIRGNMYYAKNGSDKIDYTSPVPFDITNSDDIKNIIRLPEHTKKVVLEYTLNNKTNPKNPFVSPSMDDIRVLAK